MNRQDQIKTCPFCCGAAHVQESKEKVGYLFVCCIECGCRTGYYRSRNMTIMVWNNRDTLNVGGVGMTDEQVKNIIRNFEMGAAVYSDNTGDYANASADLKNYWMGCAHAYKKAIETIKEAFKNESTK